MKTYPKEIFSSIRGYSNGKSKTFSVEALFARDNEVSPLVPPGYSRLRLSIFGRDGGVNANIRETEIDGIYQSSIACINAPQTNDELKQVPFFMGKYKGKTPAEVILETKDLNILREQKNFLKDNIDKFPRNKELVDAINAAAIAYKNGTLTQAKGSTNIYHIESRPVGKEDENGMKRVYGLDIDYFNGTFTVTINECRAVVNKTENGAYRVQYNGSTNQKKLSFDLSTNEWISCISKCKKTADAFDMIMFKTAWNEATRLEEESKQN